MTGKHLIIIKTGKLPDDRFGSYSQHIAVNFYACSGLQ